MAYQILKESFVSRGNKRRGTPKSRGGCPTCKIRRVKCDETRPYCQRCVTTGRKCEGYAQIAVTTKFSFAPPTFVSSFPHHTAGPLNEQEAQYLNAFRHLYIVGIYGYDRSPRWAELILRAVHEEPAVRHAAVALSSLQLANHDLPLSAPQNSSNCFALEQYGMSIKTLQKLLSQRDLRSIEATLMCSILYICFEILEGSHELAEQHLANGLRLISKFDVDRDLSQAFARLDVQASSYIIGRVPILIPNSCFKDAVRFAHLGDAEGSMDQNFNQVWRFLRGTANNYRYRDLKFVPFEVLIQAQDIRFNLAQWNENFISFMEAAKGQTKDTRRIKLLQIHHITATILMAGCLYSDEIIYDTFDDEFRTIVHLSSELLLEKSMKTSVKVFSIDMAIIDPLYLTAVKCRIIEVRARAIKLLQSAPQEGIWNGQIMAKVAQQVRDIEEDGLDEFHLLTKRVPDFRRVHATGSDIDQKNRRSKIVCTLLSNGIEGDWERRERHIRW